MNQYPKLIIDGFLGFKSTEIEIRPITVLIGPQATGKSVIAKLLYYFYDYMQHVRECCQEELNKREIDKRYKLKFQEYFNPSSWQEDAFSIKLTLGSEYISISHKPSAKLAKDLDLDYSDWFSKEAGALIRYTKNRISKISEDEDFDRYQAFGAVRRKLQSDVKEKFQSTYPLIQNFIPAGRSFFSNLQNNIFGFLTENNSIDPFLSMFGRTYDSIKRQPNSVRIRNRIDPSFAKEISNLIRSVISGDFQHDKGKDYLKINSGRRISMAHASSGQQEATPMGVFLQHIAHSRDYGHRLLYVEEPEAHLFPSSQKGIIDVLATLFNSRPGDLGFFITTHSPYVLSSLNNLIYAHRVRSRTADPKKIDKIIPYSRHLNINSIGAYMIGEGKAISIVNRDEGLIDASRIDEVSNLVASEFEALVSVDE